MNTYSTYWFPYCLAEMYGFWFSTLTLVMALPWHVNCPEDICLHGYNEYHLFTYSGEDLLYYYKPGLIPSQNIPLGFPDHHPLNFALPAVLPLCALYAWISSLKEMTGLAAALGVNVSVDFPPGGITGFLWLGMQRTCIYIHMQVHVHVYMLILMPKTQYKALLCIFIQANT